VRHKTSLHLELLLLLMLATLWGGSYSFMKVAVETIPPLTLIAARTLIAGSLLLVAVRWLHLRMPSEPAIWRRFIVQACLNAVVPFVLIAWAVRTIDAGLAAILNSTTPIFAFLLTALITRHEPVTSRKLFGVSLGILGVCLIIGLQALSGAGHEIGAELAVVTASVCFAGAAIFGRGFRDVHPLVPAAGSLLSGAAILLPLSMAIDRPWTLTPSAESVFALIVLSVFSTALAFAIYFRLVNTLGTVGITAQSYLRVPIGVAIGAVFLGEALTTSAWVGLVCVLGGVTAMTLPPRRRRPGRLAESTAPATSPAPGQ
jgi:drug/metabolite transporter (DMT)-like permease